ncbi:MAG TPA: TIGR03668 family PPOX class F420-dependent oxidoreductase [Solirubrobacteraceae bacterium]|nr:TIGR03668 family PPOX class F420-dependent oxidoreductase [Solirubrobacteraceae bacterium]
MNEARARELLGGARVARLGTIAPDGRPRLVPICFALAGDVIYHAVDHKPKATRRLARLADLAADPRATVLADHYEEDWSALWWVRAEGRARVLEVVGDPEAARALDLLAGRYPQYRARRPAGPVIALDLERITGWAARDTRATG